MQAILLPDHTQSQQIVVIINRVRLRAQTGSDSRRSGAFGIREKGAWGTAEGVNRREQARLK
jgi:hypothetical protein